MTSGDDVGGVVAEILRASTSLDIGTSVQSSGVGWDENFLQTNGVLAASNSR